MVLALLNVLKLQSRHDFVNETATYKAQRGITKNIYQRVMSTTMAKTIRAVHDKTNEMDQDIDFFFFFYISSYSKF